MCSVGFDFNFRTKKKKIVQIDFSNHLDTQSLIMDVHIYITVTYK